MPATQSLTLWIPGLLHPQRIDEAQDALKSLELPHLQKLLSRADYRLSKRRAFEAQACYLFHQTEKLPSAITRAAVLVPEAFENGIEEFWLSVDPVQMIPDRDTLILFPAKDLAITEEESRALLESFNRHFAQDQVELLYGQADQWFMRVKQPIDLQSTDLHEVAYRSVTDAYPQGNAANYWRQLINETQMLFYSHPVNEARRNKGFPEINSIWPWGEGSLQHKIKERSAACVCADNVYLQGMAKLCCARSCPSMNAFEQWQSQSINGHSLVYPDNLCAAIPNMQLEEWLTALENVENEWAKPIDEALRTGGLSSVFLDLGAGKQFYLTNRKIKRFWRWKKNWRALCN
ncbi:hypothetical protein [Thiomicrorhabdus xiamenensis]|uniref:Uncharacterized protein n=1 Tax=Thiomicrorhabdus xiamenensis TaxID=2739063 RepID=A0A7D4TFY0_9GAMM|nr:hypothetical protein [Thiomicrorhabdus xiamenensis]QKI89188.1 hypothetical protein HQN79_06245 [Thiomicrorhabdus xiamenensis]